MAITKERMLFVPSFQLAFNSSMHPYLPISAMPGAEWVDAGAKVWISIESSKGTLLNHSMGNRCVYRWANPEQVDRLPGEYNRMTVIPQPTITRPIVITSTPKETEKVKVFISTE